MWYVGLDVHADATAISIRSARGVVVRREVVITSATTLRHALATIRGRVKVVCEVGPLACWIKSTLETTLREVIVCDRRRTQLVPRGNSKSDQIDADRLSEALRLGSVHRVYMPGKTILDLRRHAKHYLRTIADRTRIIQRLRALFLESGVRVRPPLSAPGRVPIRRLPAGASKVIARAHLRHLDVATALVREARTEFTTAAAAYPEYELLQTIPYIGAIRAALLIAIIGDPWRFRNQRTLWAYAGLAVVQKISSEHRIMNGELVRNDRLRGLRLSKAAQPLLKKIFRDVALHASFGRGPFRAIYDSHVARGCRPSIARLALARKIASIVAAIWKLGVPFRPSLVEPRKKASGRASNGQVQPPAYRTTKATALTICRPEGSPKTAARQRTG